jgi:hypothetical protein
VLPPGIDGTPTKKGARITQIRGALGADIGVKGVRLAMLITDPKKGPDGKVKVTQVVAKVKGDGSFSFGRLPAGPKSIMVQAAGKNRTLGFAKTSMEAGNNTSVIPDATPPAPAGVAPKSRVLGTGRVSEELEEGLDLGKLKIGEKGIELADTSKNPLGKMDTDGDGIPDLSDDDIDGDGIPNAKDPSPYSNPANGPDVYDGWGWEADMPAAFDEDGDGKPNWEDPSYTGETGWCSPTDASCTQAFICKEEPESCVDGQLPAGDPEFCSAFPHDSKCKGFDFCKVAPEAPECVDPVGFCKANPEAAECLCEKDATSCKGPDSSSPPDACVLDSTSTACICEKNPQDESCADICSTDPGGLACFCSKHADDLKCVCHKDATHAGCACELHPDSIDCKCEMDPMAAVCVCKSDPNASVCGCAATPTEPGCACMVGPNSPQCACETTPGGKACECLKTPTEAGCACILDDMSAACTCEKDPMHAGCNDPCVKDPQSIECTCSKEPQAPACDCTMNASAPGCPTGAGGAGGAGGMGAGGEGGMGGAGGEGGMGGEAGAGGMGGEAGMGGAGGGPLCSSEHGRGRRARSGQRRERSADVLPGMRPATAPDAGVAVAGVLRGELRSVHRAAGPGGPPGRRPAGRQIRRRVTIVEKTRRRPGRDLDPRS